MTDEPRTPWFQLISKRVLAAAGPGKDDRVGVDLLKGERAARPGDVGAQDLYRKAEQIKGG